MFSTKRLLFVLLAIALLVGAGSFGLTRSSKGTAAYNRSIAESAQAFRGSAKRGEPDAVGSTSESAGLRGTGGNGPLTAAEAHAAANAYPAAEIAPASTLAAQRAYNDVKIRGNNGSKKQPGLWNAVGPTHAQVPGVLGGAFAPWVLGQDYVTSGRVTALAIGPSCDQGRCTLYVGAAGGGIWKTDHALHTNNIGWKRASNGLGSNAIGSLAIDPRNANVIYAGTGEPNTSGDSEAGVGLFRSTDGGDSWSLVPGTDAIGSTRAISSIVIDPRDSNTIYIGTARAIRGVASTGGAVSRTGRPQPILGVYKSTDGGATWSLVFDSEAAGSVRGVSKVVLDPANPSNVYVAAFGIGMYRSLAGAPYTQVFAPLSAFNYDKVAMALAVLPNGKTRAYVTDGTDATATLFRSDDINAAAPAYKNITSPDRTSPYYGPYNFCTTQCSYDEDVISPAGAPDTVYLIGSYTYGEAGLRSNARAVIKSTTAGEPDANNRAWADLTYDSHAPAFGTHPDQHALVVDPSNPNIYFEGSDGGVVRNDGTFTDATAQCQWRYDNGLIGAASLNGCKKLLWAIPTTLYSLNDGLDTLQFTSFSVNGSQIQGGTQDNGTWLSSDSNNWNQTIYGDGGLSGFDSGNPAIRFNQFYFGATDTNFQSGEPTKWVITSGPLLQSKESVQFYWPEIADPTTPGTLFTGFEHVWRTTDDGGDQAYLEANCPEFTVSAADPKCGDWQPLGPKLTDAWFGSKAGGNLGAVARATSDKTTLWAGTSTGRLFISKNANAAAATVAFTRLDSDAQPNRFVSSIAVDPANANHAWVTYMAYNTTVGSTAPGHVYDVRYNPALGTASFSDISYDLGDLPANGVAVDPASGDLYLANDFGVLRLVNGSHSWTVAGSGLPVVEVSGITIANGKLYAATHGLGGWTMNLG